MAEWRNYSVCKMDTENNNKTEILYDCIEKLEEADLLAQYAMKNRKSYNELIVIFPGWNRGVKATPEILELAKKYKTE